MRSIVRSILVCGFCWGFVASHGVAAEPVDFNRDIRPILSNLCFKCHGPDAKERKGGSDGLRLDTADGLFADQGGTQAVVPGKPGDSELLRRVIAEDQDEVMPPPASGRRLTPREIELLTHWIEQGAPFAKHWSYATPQRPELPKPRDGAWVRNPIDQFVLARLEREGLKPSEPADPYAIARRLSLDLTGLPPTVAEVDAFVQDGSPHAYEALVDRLLAKKSYGEHWARMWLDLARYADSAGYADDPTRTIWAYRDYVIQAFNANKPFDQFTIEQLAGDLLPNPTDEQLMATAFHRNTLTNSEGGTNDEEFRNVAIVDRVNTTWSVWMGTSITCSQCHNHKYDPFSQADFYRFFAILNNTADADRRDEAPLLEFFTPEQRTRQTELDAQQQQLASQLRTPTDGLRAAFAAWDAAFPRELKWQTPAPLAFRSRRGAAMTVQPDQSVIVAAGADQDTYEIELPLAEPRLTAIRLEALADPSLPSQGPGHAGGNFVLSRVTAQVVPPESSPTQGRFLRIEMSGKEKILSLAEVQVLQGDKNLAQAGKATQSTTDFDGPAQYAIDGNTDGKYTSKSVTHTAISADPWWEVDLQSQQAVERIVVWNRTDSGVEGRLVNFRVALLNEQRQPVWETQVASVPNPKVELTTTGVRTVSFAAAIADATQDGFDAGHVLQTTLDKAKGWAVGGHTGQNRSLTLLLASPVEIPAGAKLLVSLEQQSQHPKHTLGKWRLSTTADPRVAEAVRLPAAQWAVVSLPADKRTADQSQKLLEFYLVEIAPELQATRDQLAKVQKERADIKPQTVPILRELASDKRRPTHIQRRGNYLDLGDQVTAGLPDALHPAPADGPIDRMAMAKWLVDPQNPLMPRVVVNRFWEQLFGLGLVRTSEEFGSQGELPSHPELLDWLAVEFRESGWNVQRLLKLIAMSATYRQSSKVTPELVARDPENRLLARGPRFRMPAEMVRDHALAVSGLLSTKMLGPSVKPPQPSLGLSAAFGSAIDWQTSGGEDKYRRGLYTEWRRSNPYPSMITFDAPNREVCTLRRARTNTPLQALVTLNDPVYVEAAQALARRVMQAAESSPERARLAFRICLARPPYEQELDRLVQLFQDSRVEFAKTPELATQMATNPLGPLPSGLDAADAAAWTVVANVLLNLDETLMKR